ncbi:MAG TPA: DHA2 family efflux MFS transporter permease subunit [Terracidiphilus sp.]|nr:DHA2 family efflux MFS transporter permease subunit [Terracidiphilus sp.]
MSSAALARPGILGKVSRPTLNQWVIAMSVTLATFMEVLDSSIANVALPQIAGNLGATPEEATWVLTSYLVSAGIVLPMSGWLSDLMGRKRFYMFCVFLFTGSSMLCGLSTSLPMLVFCRVLQGAGGGGLQPTEQAILADTFKPEQRSMGFAVYGMAILVAPTIGPTLGGWLTDSFSWHWIFFINLPIGVISLLLTQRVIKDPPHVIQRGIEVRRRRVDSVGITTIVLGVGFVQYALDKGQELDWLAANSIRIALFSGVTFLLVMIWREWTTDDPIMKLRLLHNWNFAASVLFNFVLGVAMSGSLVLIPQFLQLQMGYSAELTGMAMSPAGLVLALLMPIGGFIATKFDPRKVIAFGFFCTSASLLVMTRMSALIDFQTIVWVRVAQVVGIPFIFIPITTLSYAGIAQQENNQISGITNFVRNIGGAVGMSFVMTFLARHRATSRTELVSHLTHGNIFFNRFFSMLSHGGQDPGLTHRALAQLQMMVDGQASTLAFLNVFFVMGMVVMALVPLPFLMKRPSKRDLANSGGMH